MATLLYIFLGNESCGERCMRDRKPWATRCDPPHALRQKVESMVMTSLDVETHGRHILRARINSPLALHSSGVFSDEADPMDPEQSQRSAQVVTPPARVTRQIDAQSATFAALRNRTRGNGIFGIVRSQRMKLCVRDVSRRLKGEMTRQGRRGPEGSAEGSTAPQRAPSEMIVSRLCRRLCRMLCRPSL